MLKEETGRGSEWEGKAKRGEERAASVAASVPDSSASCNKPVRLDGETDTLSSRRPGV